MVTLGWASGQMTNSLARETPHDTVWGGAWGTPPMRNCPWASRRALNPPVELELAVIE